ncbi:cytidine diphosphoramidate kinase [Amycolatopsis endophytica]|uniref:Adenylylsulfate kinase n=1 Tax=Amycolatopsis endophytica TaxID=860233 RepID=A0A853BFK8_9PSEU|nr:adenylyl-sulfate kinase [Amycolatopsis endophytica]NYI93347.1 adenylylsulfate kinase [Amycolatopsis endophytica]
MTGGVVWITGLSGAGKSAVAGALADRLRRAGLKPVLLDGDAVRSALGARSFGADARRQLAQTYGRLCALLAGQGHLVVCATISLRHEVHQWNRRHLHRYAEVFLDVPFEELRRRDPKGIYRDGDEVVGEDVVAELPLEPDLRITNHGTTSPRAAAERIFAHCAATGWW